MSRSDATGNERTMSAILPLTLDNVRFAVGERAILEGVSTQIGAGSRTVILGPNGAGKSVFMRLCHGLLQPTSGTVRWAIPQADARLQQAMVFQRPVMLRRSAIANVAYGLKLRGVPKEERLKRAHEALEQVGLSALAR